MTTASTSALLAHGPVGVGGGLESWVPLSALLVAFAGVVATLFAAGRPGDHPVAAGRFLLRVPNALERVTGVPGWAAATVGTALFGLLVAGVGFYTDVAWHVALGRDEALFTAPHTAIVVGLALIAASGGLAVGLASLGNVATGLRAGPLRIPFSAIPLALLGVSALSGFALDELWHHAYGIDVTMWSPTHLLMIVGASLAGLASWLVLAEAGVRPWDSRRSAALHGVAAWFTLQGTASVQGEFSFGVPQFSQVYHPVLVLLAAGFSLVAARLVLGRGSTLLVAGAYILLEGTTLVADSPVTLRSAGFYLGSAAAIEAVALLWGTQRRLRFALLCGAGVATVGLAAEWWWNQGAHQPWTTGLLPEAALLAAVAAFATAVLAVAVGSTLRGEGAARGVPPAAVILAGIATLAVLMVPLPRTTSPVIADVGVDEVEPGLATLRVTLEPADAADGAYWFQALSWQGGGLVAEDLRQVAPGEWVTDAPVPISGAWKTLVRLHRGSDLMAVPVWLPADPEIGAPQIPAVDRRQAFEPETRYLLRETREGSPWFAVGITATVLVLAALWVTALAFATARIGARRPRETETDALTSGKVSVTQP